MQAMDLHAVTIGGKTMLYKVLVLLLLLLLLLILLCCVSVILFIAAFDEGL